MHTDHRMDKRCSSCAQHTENPQKHPLLHGPLCHDCAFNYSAGEFTVQGGNEIYCRWWVGLLLFLLLYSVCVGSIDNEKNLLYTCLPVRCGEGEGQLILCDSCPKSFCVRCLENNFGAAEIRRILELDDRWNCEALREMVAIPRHPNPVRPQQMQAEA